MVNIFFVNFDHILFACSLFFVCFVVAKSLPALCWYLKWQILLGHGLSLSSVPARKINSIWSLLTHHRHHHHLQQGVLGETKDGGDPFNVGEVGDAGGLHVLLGGALVLDVAKVEQGSKHLHVNRFNILNVFMPVHSTPTIFILRKSQFGHHNHYSSS